jgi:hypothetical protein
VSVIGVLTSRHDDDMDSVSSSLYGSSRASSTRSFTVDFVASTYNSPVSKVMSERKSTDVEA